MFLVRVLLPDRPGSLGALATALGEVGGDITGLDVVERGPEGAVDDLLVELPANAMADSLLTAAHGVPGVTIESLRPYPAAGDIHRDLDVVDAIAASPDKAEELLVEHAPNVFRAGWAVTLQRVAPSVTDAATDGVLVRVRSAGAPEGDIPAPFLPLTGARRLGINEEWVPERWHTLGMELAVAPLGNDNTAILLGRPGGPRFRASEVVRLAHLAGIAATVTATAAAAGLDRATSN
jgi:hypothetical protein